MIITFWAAVEAPTKLGIRWWTGRGFWAIFRASIKSQILFRIIHFQAFGSSSFSLVLLVSLFEASAMASRALASRLSLSASKAASSKAASFRELPSLKLISLWEFLEAGNEGGEWRLRHFFKTVCFSVNGADNRIRFESICLRQIRMEVLLCWCHVIFDIPVCLWTENNGDKMIGIERLRFASTLEL